MTELTNESHIKDQLMEIFNGLTRKVGDYPLQGNPMDRLADTLDLASADQDREMSMKLLERESERCREVLGVLHRINVGTYGICEDCGEEIGPERLSVYPTTMLCIECKKEQEACRRHDEGIEDDRARRP
jgi:RNA polymerase-binding protein DksA